METCPAEVAVNTRDDMSEVEKIREAEHFAKEVDEYVPLSILPGIGVG